MSDDRKASAPRIGALANLPIFFKLDGKRVVLAGAGEPALWKAELLAAAGAIVEVFAEAFPAAFFELAAAPPNGQIVLADRKWTPKDLQHAALAVGTFSDDAEADAFASAARSVGVPVNVVDRPKFCDFQFGAIVNRSPLVVGISTDGAAPVFGQAIRSLVEGLLPQSFKVWAAAARDLRRDSDRLGGTAIEKRRFWQRFTDFALLHAAEAPTKSDIDRLIEDDGGAAQSGSVTFVDISDDADALTLGTIRALRSADDIFFEAGISAAVLDFARREAKRHAVSSGGPATSAIGEQVAQVAAGGRTVVYLRRNETRGVDGDDEAVAAIRAAGVAVIRLS